MARKHKKNKKEHKREENKSKSSEKKAMPRKFSLKNQREIALDFAADVHKKFSNLIKASILFGSQAKKTETSGSDIDIIFIIDDATIDWDLELISWYREELAKIISANSNSVDLHINTIKLTTWWNDLMHGDPVVINIIRYGDALIDLGGFFNPLKALLLQGKIHSTPEAVFEALQRSPLHLTRSKAAEMGAIEGIYWSMVDSAQAALMSLGALPPSPEHIAAMLKESFTDKKMLHIDFVKWMRDIHVLHKSIAHGNIRDIRGAEIDLWQERAHNFMKKMTELIDSILESKRK